MDRKTWERIGRYAIRSSPWTITKAYVKGEATYLLWRNEQIIGGTYSTAEEAKERAR